MVDVLVGAKPARTLADVPHRARSRRGAAGAGDVDQLQARFRHTARADRAPVAPAHDASLATRRATVHE